MKKSPIKKKSPDKEMPNLPFVLIAVLAAVALILGLMVLLDWLPYTAEVQIGMVVVIAAGAVLVLLFMMAIAFDELGLGDPGQALGLPEGTVRAMIAVFLVVIFVVVGLYLFRVVAEDRGSPATLRGLTLAEVKALNLEASNQRIDGLDREYNESEEFIGTYTVRVRGPITESGSQMGSQMVSVLGTLTAAVAAFYFGTASVRAAAKALQPAQPAPRIRAVNPKEGKKGEELDLRVLGRDFRSPRSVKLVRDGESMIASDIVSNDTEIRCTLKVDKEPNGAWDLVVENEDGAQDRLEDAFSITKPPDEQPPAGQPPEE